MVHFCTAGGCTSTSRPAADGKEKKESDDKQVIVLDDPEGTVLNGVHMRFHCLPSLPKLKSPKDQSQYEKEEIQRVVQQRRDWIHALGRADKLPKDIRLCSLHFAPSSYNPLPHGYSSYLKVPTKKLLLPTAVPTENLVNKTKSILKMTPRSARITQKSKASHAALNQTE
jgi:THAP domain